MRVPEPRVLFRMAWPQASALVARSGIKVSRGAAAEVYQRKATIRKLQPDGIKRLPLATL